MEKQDSREKELLEQIKFCLFCNNEAQAIRLIERFKFIKQNELFTNNEVIMILQKRLLSIGIISSLEATKTWFKQYKKINYDTQIKNDKMKVVIIEPEQKAIEIINMYYINDIENILYGIDKRQAIACALIFVNNIIDFNNHLMQTFEQHSWWNKVRIEIIKQDILTEKKNKK